MSSRLLGFYCSRSGSRPWIAGRSPDARTCYHRHSLHHPASFAASQTQGSLRQRLVVSQT
jgi:hypothetical protein